jgi:hypothetical protein
VEVQRDPLRRVIFPRGRRRATLFLPYGVRTSSLLDLPQGPGRVIFDLRMPTQKLFCYVDETGMDPASRLFIVSVVITAAQRAALLADLDTIERVSGKGRHKWTHTRPAARAAYIARVVNHHGLQGALYYATYPTAGDYPVRTVLTVARAITRAAPPDAKATVFVDGLRKSQYHWFGTELRHLAIKTKKVRGVHADEADALMRLADALCGFVRAALAGDPNFAPLLSQAKLSGVVREL